MTQTFGSFIRQKRKEKMYRLNSFAKQVGISNVYLSYIESGKRPAPSRLIMQKMADVLELNAEEYANMKYLASLSRSRFSIPENVMKYLSDRPYVYKSLLLAAENELDEDAWREIDSFIRHRIYQPK